MRRRRRTLLTVALLALTGALASMLLRGDETPAARSSPNLAFRSPARPEAPATVWAVGDGASGTPVARRIGRRIAADRPARVLYLGDVYETGTLEEYAAKYTPAYGAFSRITLPTPGNHEWPNHATGYDRYWAAVTGHATPPWYRSRVGGWQLLSLNSEAPHEPGSEQHRWLTAALREATGTCILAFFHRPRRSAGKHGDQADVEPLWRTLRNRATLVLSGHDHNSQRMRPEGGRTQLVAGAGGKDLYAFDEDHPRLAFGDDRHHAALRLRLAPGGARIAFVAADGRVLDRSSVRCRPAS